MAEFLHLVTSDCWARSFGNIWGDYSIQNRDTLTPSLEDPIEAQADVIALEPRLTKSNDAQTVQLLKEEIKQLKEQNKRWQRVALELQDMVGEEAVVGEAESSAQKTRSNKRRRKMKK